MKDDLVINTNPYLRDPEALAEAICRSVESSSAIEGINVDVRAHKVNGVYKFKSTVRAPA